MHLANFGLPDDETLESAGCQGELARVQLDIFLIKFGNIRPEGGQVDFPGEFLEAFGIQFDAVDVVSHKDIVRGFQTVFFGCGLVDIQIEGVFLF